MWNFLFKERLPRIALLGSWVRIDVNHQQREDAFAGKARSDILSRLISSRKFQKSRGASIGCCNMPMGIR